MSVIEQNLLNKTKEKTAINRARILALKSLSESLISKCEETDTPNEVTEIANAIYLLMIKSTEDSGEINDLINQLPHV